MAAGEWKKGGAATFLLIIKCLRKYVVLISTNFSTLSVKERI